VGFFGNRSKSEQAKDSNRERQRETSKYTKVSQKAKNKVQRDRDNDSRDKLTNYKVKKVPAIVPGSTILNAGQKIRQKTFEVNRDYYRDNVVGKTGYKDTFEDYEKYITGRGQGNLDAMGRTINTGGGGGGNQNQGIELAKSATGTATTTGPGEIQKTATNTITTKDAKKNTTDAILVANKRKSRKSTIKTSATGLEENYTLAKKKLLG
tara:strand:- start:332 stop:958 length:627 start_codon:yes stop_codon:yes gene_type:complete